jgi:hypothetical protein
VSWTADFTDALLVLKRAGWGFEQAWEEAAAGYPPRLRELGGREAAASLFELERGDSMLAWFKGACRDAWFNAPAVGGGRSRLHLLPGLVSALGVRDESSSARKAGLGRAA